MSGAWRLVVRLLSTTIAAGMIVGVAQPGIASSAPTRASPSMAWVVGSAAVGHQRHDLWIRSPAMGRDVPVTVLHPAHARPRGTLYLLDGGGRKTAVSDWIGDARADRYFGDKDVNVVLPGGQGAFYTNWQNVDATFGRPQWETFLTVELPPLIDGRFHGDGKNAIAGLSMGGQAAFTLATRRPGLYTGVGSISACPFTTGVLHESQIRAAVIRDGGDPTKMWGPWGGAGMGRPRPGPSAPGPRGQACVPRVRDRRARPSRPGDQARPGSPPRGEDRVGGGARELGERVLDGVRASDAGGRSAARHPLPGGGNPCVALLGAGPDRDVPRARDGSLIDHE